MLHLLECVTHVGPRYGEENNIQIIIKLVRFWGWGCSVGKVHEVLTLVLQHPFKKLDAMVCACNCTEAGASLGPLGPA